MKDENDAVKIDLVFGDKVLGDNLVITGKRWKGSVTPEDVRSTWSTPQWMFDYFNNEIGPFDIDGAASEKNAKCETFWTKEQDSLSFEWPAKSKIFINPPFSNPRPWIEKCVTEANERGCTICVILPDDISTKWFRMAVDGAAEMYGLVSDGKNTGRVGFVHPVTGDVVKGNPKGSFAFIFRRHKSPLKTHWISRNEMEQANSDIV